MNQQLPRSAACERNQQVIFDEIKHYLIGVQRVLEIGSCTGQHGEFLARHLPQMDWQLSDLEEYLAGLELRWRHAGLKNLQPPKSLDVNADSWLDKSTSYSAIYTAIYTANTLHIMDKATSENCLNGANQYLDSRGLLFVYGPFKYAGQFTSSSNEAFDASLKARQFGDGIKDFEWVEEILIDNRFELVRDITMPANNQLLIWQLTD